ncbi:MAG: hypothetical protein KC586_11575 [Myxococcales bacterium]|nr:hypothetical protein [Myxococcales bacterium]
MRYATPLLFALASTLFLGADCRKSEVACIDWSGRTLDLQAYDWAECSTANAQVCSGLQLPDRVTLRILDEPVQLRELQCEMPRAELVAGDFPNLEFLGPADATLVVSGDFAVAESVRIRDTECYGRFFIAAARIGDTSRGNRQFWVTPGDGATTWAFGYRFVPNDSDACADIQADCTNECFAEVSAVE